MTELKRDYVVPLRRKTRLAPKWRRSKKAVSVLKEFIRKHMKTDDVIICSELNEHIWRNGSKNPPGKVSVTALRAEIAGENRTIVNLTTAGVDKQKELYAAPEQPKAPAQEAKASEDNKKEVKDAEVKEEKPVEEKKEEKVEDSKDSNSEESKTEKKEETKKEEVKKNG